MSWPCRYHYAGTHTHTRHSSAGSTSSIRGNSVRFFPSRDTMRKRSCRRRRRRRGKKRERQRQVKMGQHLPHMAVQREYGGRQVSRDGMGTQNKKIVPPTNPTLGLSVYYSLPIYTPASFHRKEMYMTALPNSGQTHGKQLYPLSLSLSLEPIKRSIYYLTRPDEVSSLINCHCSLPFFFFTSQSP